MAPLSYKAITSSPPFTFVVGEDENEHTIHSALIAEQSHYFQDLVNGDCVASTERRVVWKQVEEETFTRFSQFVYTGDYDEVKLKKRKERVKTATSSQGESSKASKTVSKEEKPVLESLISPEKTKSLWDNLQKGYQTRSGEFPSLRLPPSYEPDEDYTDIFLCHVRVYFFAKQYGILKLGDLSLLKLFHALKSFNICAESYSEINQLFRYLFEQIAEKETQNDPLYMIIWLYAACKVEDLWKSAEFQELTMTSPNFSSGLITAILGQNCID